MDYSLLDSGDPQLYDIRTHVPGPAGSLPLTAEMLLNRPSGDPCAWEEIPAVLVFEPLEKFEARWAVAATLLSLMHRPARRRSHEARTLA